MKVVFFHRRNGPSNSIEILFDTVRKNLQKDIEPEVFISKYPSQGLVRRIYNIFEAVIYQGDVNHVTGDVHFLTYFLKKKRTVLTIHDCVSVMHSKGIKRMLLKFFWYTLPAQRVQYITVISENTKKELLRIINFPEDRIFLIPNCVNEDFRYVEKKLFNQEKPLILQIGTIFNKNIPMLSKALKGFSCTLDIVGKLTDEQKQILEENKIDYINSFGISEQQLIEKYKQADILSFVSTYEGFGLPIIEAQAIGTPVITSNISPMKEVAGDGACLVDPYNSDSIKNGIKKICQDEQYRCTLIQNGLDNVKKYSPEYIANMYANLYHKISIENNSTTKKEYV